MKQRRNVRQIAEVSEGHVLRKNVRRINGALVFLAACVGVALHTQDNDYRSDPYCFRQSLFRRRANRSSDNNKKEKARAAFTCTIFF